MSEETPEGEPALRELRDAVSRATVDRLLPHLLALPDDRLRDVLAEVLAGRFPYGHSARGEARLFLAVPGPAPKRKAPAWRHRAVARVLGERKKRGRLAFEGRCAVCETLLCADAPLVVCPVCGGSETRLGRL
ncbi:hypothetical protein AB0J42_31885 [Nonomuraea sp. NPDC049649]|uniref:hypothetical protein n=1 Tax=Nonomuraea sp. NPDC049649 TaxID=3155776 RepID=UPI003413A523